MHTVMITLPARIGSDPNTTKYHLGLEPDSILSNTIPRRVHVRVPAVPLISLKT
jgi:hypothetical protein